MRDYAKVSPQFWTGETGKQIRTMGQECQLIALYLMTCPTSHAFGLYYLPLETISHETGISISEVRKALRRLSEAPSKGVGSPFCQYEEETEWVFVLRMAHYQVGARLGASDNRSKWVRKELEKARKSGLFNAFLEEYRKAYQLHDVDPLRSPLEAPSDPLRSNEKEIEKENDLCSDVLSLNGASAPCGAPLHPTLELKVQEPKPKKLTPEDVAEGWNNICVPAGLPKIVTMDKVRRRNTLARIAESYEHARAYGETVEDYWGHVLTNISQSAWCRGLRPSSEHKDWKADIDFLVANSTRPLRAREGKYV